MFWCRRRIATDFISSGVGGSAGGDGGGGMEEEEEEEEEADFINRLSEAGEEVVEMEEVVMWEEVCRV